ncbi:hypothetical protein CMUS01_05939 [Colletotrichum musicola]|uniref:Uncharacterized protein n=1 Tax=Colletotrichum musicola TaxID=2175873 RepID=A0A8H6NIN3_9PEZI|nr:hypothetical protein CMUS01_05939 [Colletotrichum musicola]
MMDVNGTGPTRHDREPGPHRPMRQSKPTTPGRPVGSGREDAGGPFARLPLLLVEEHRVGIGRCVAGVRLSLRLTAFDSGGELPFRLPWPTPVNKARAAGLRPEGGEQGEGGALSASGVPRQRQRQRQRLRVRGVREVRRAR